MNDIEWACKWVQVIHYETGQMLRRRDQGWEFVSTADLAEAVRGKLIDGYSLGASSTETLADHVFESLAHTLLFEGTAAFISAVREEVDD